MRRRRWRSAKRVSLHRRDRNRVALGRGMDGRRRRPVPKSRFLRECLSVRPSITFVTPAGWRIASWLSDRSRPPREERPPREREANIKPASFPPLQVFPRHFHQPYIPNVNFSRHANNRSGRPELIMREFAVPFTWSNKPNEWARVFRPFTIADPRRSAHEFCGGAYMSDDPGFTCSLSLNFVDLRQ